MNTTQNASPGWLLAQEPKGTRTFMLYTPGEPVGYALVKRRILLRLRAVVFRCMSVMQHIVFPS